MKKNIYCGGDHCSELWNLPCLESHGLPKKSKKVKKETKVQELERRIKALEAHRCNPVQVPNTPYVPQQYSGYCQSCGRPWGSCLGHGIY